LTRRCQAIFAREACERCHPPPLYTNNRLTPATGPESIGTDPTLALRTRRGTGYCQAPSLKGLWYRGPFEHNGSVATLEDWFDSARTREDYVPTGWKRNGARTRAVKGHEFGLNLSTADKESLIAFLKTL
jgi:cytochrome c peroxidase